MSRTARAAGRRRSPLLAMVGLAATLTMVVSGFAAIAFAPAASAALVCPDGYTLNGSVCEKYETTPALSSTDYSCPEGWTLVEGETPMCERTTEGHWEYTDPTATTTYKCDDDWTPVEGDPSMCQKTVPGKPVVIDATATTTLDCGSHKVLGSDVGLTPGDACYERVAPPSGSSGTKQQGTDGNWYQKTGVRPSSTTTYSCPEGYTGPSESKKCTQPGQPTVITKPAKAKTTYTCPEGWTPVKGSDRSKTFSHDDDDSHGTITSCKKWIEGGKESKPATGTTTWFCPEGDPAWAGPFEGEGGMYCDRTLTVDPTDVPEGGPTDNPTTPTDTSTPPTVAQVVTPITEVPTTVNVPQEGNVPTTGKPAKPTKPTKPVNKPAKGTVPSNVNAGVGGNVPTTATIPTAVNAGGGSSAPQGAPMWAYVLLLAGAAGAIGAGARLAGSRKG